MEMENRSVVARDLGRGTGGCDYKGVAQGRTFVMKKQFHILNVAVVT